MYCWSCGKNIPDNSQFCVFCGKGQVCNSGSRLQNPVPQNSRKKGLWIVLASIIVIAITTTGLVAFLNGSTESTSTSSLESKSEVAVAVNTEGAESEVATLENEKPEEPSPTQAGAAESADTDSTVEALSTENEYMTSTCWMYCAGTTIASFYAVCFFADGTYHMIQKGSYSESTGEYTYADGMLYLDGEPYEWDDNNESFQSCYDYAAMGYSDGGFYRGIYPDDETYWEILNSEEYTEQKIRMEEQDYLIEALAPIREVAGAIYNKSISDIEEQYGPILSVEQSEYTFAYTFDAFGDDVTVIYIKERDSAGHVVQILSRQLETFTSSGTDEEEFAETIEHYGSTTSGHAEIDNLYSDFCSYSFNMPVEYKSFDAPATVSLEVECTIGIDSIICSIYFDDY